MQTMPEGSGSPGFFPTHTMKPTERRVVGESPEQSALWRFRACKISNGDYKTVVGINPELAREIIPEHAQLELRERSLRNWLVRRFHPVSEQIDHDPKWAGSLAETDKLPVIKEALHDTDLSDGQPVSAFILKTPESVPAHSIHNIILPEPGAAGYGRQIVLLNGNRDKKHAEVHMSLSCANRQKAEVSGNIWLKSGDAIVLESCAVKGEKDQWRKLASKDCIDIRLETNPLLRNSGEIQIGADSVAVSHPYDGEYFIPPYLLNRLLEKKLHQHQGVDWTSCNHAEAIRAYLLRLDQQLADNSAGQSATGHIVFEHLVSNHIVAVRVHVEAGKVLCFIQDGLGEDSPDARKIRDLLAEQIRDVFPDLPIVMGVPSENFQMDYYSCGVIAAKAMTFFAKQGDRIDALLRDIPAPPPGETKVSFLPLASLPAGLLKMCQRPGLINDSGRLTETVSQRQGTSLGNYFASYRTQMPDNTRQAGFRWVEGAAIAKRYQYFSELFDSATVTERTRTIERVPVTGHATVTRRDEQASGSTSAAAVTTPTEQRAGQKRKAAPAAPPEQDPGAGKQRKDPKQIESTEFLFKMASDPSKRAIVSWVPGEPYLCHVSDPAALAAEWQNTTGGTSKFANLARTLRYHTGQEMLKCPLKRKYRFNPNDPNVIRWQREAEEQRSQPVASSGAGVPEREAAPVTDEEEEWVDVETISEDSDSESSSPETRP